jgi:DNA repair exonuclease SbcCD ATPase subunit
MNYADVVTEYLQEKLQCFNIPYTPKLSDKFKIEMYTEDNQIVPTVSGGQEMQIGISLHLALHELFSQSFPLLVIDEGTTHLDTTNRKAYFEIIKKLKANEKLQQILIIDHDEGLSTVVDNVINLNEL